MMLDTKAQGFFDKNINLMVPWYLMAAYAYYKEDDPILSDYFFDNMAKVMLDKWNEIEHFHKHLIGPMDLAAGTYLGEYPERVIGGLHHLRPINKRRKRKR
jgi:NAD-dependent DNA ligase